MNRAQLEHVIRAAATIAGDDEIVVIGSQAILGQFPDAPAELVVSKDVADRSTLLERLACTPLGEERRRQISRQVEADFAA